MKELFKAISRHITNKGLDETTSGTYNFSFDYIGERFHVTPEFVKENAEKVANYIDPEIVLDLDISENEFSLCFALHYVCEHCSSYQKDDYGVCELCECNLK